MEHLSLTGEFKATAPNTMGFFPFDMHHLTEEMVERAEKELGETSEIREQALIETKRIIQEINLNCPLDDNYLLQFLRVRKFNVERTIDTIRKYYNVKKNHAAIFGKKDFESIIKVCREEMCIVLPYRDIDGSIIMVIQMRHWNATELSFPTFIHAITTLLLGCVDLHPATQICGVKLICDVKGLGINHLFHMLPRNLHLVAEGASTCLPVRFQAFHVFNESAFISYLWKILKFALSEKLRKRVHFHSSNFESLHSKINPALLPESLGGILVYDNMSWVKLVKDLEPRYFERMGYGFDS